MTGGPHPPSPSGRSDRSVVRLATGLFGVVLCCMAVAVGLAVLNVVRASSAAPPEADATILLTLVMGAFPVAGIVVATHAPRNAVGWILLAIGLMWAASGIADAYVRYGLVTAPGSLPRPDLVATLFATAWVPGVGLIGTFLLLCFPDGHLPSARWRPFAWTVAGTLTCLTILPPLLPTPLADAVSDPAVAARLAGVAKPLGVPALTPLADHMIVLVVALPLGVTVCVAGSAFSLVARHRRAQGLERLQLRWLTAAAAGTAAVFTVTMVASLVVGGEVTGGPLPAWLGVLQGVSPFAFALIPVAIVVAIRRHRLYEIDRIVSRTVAYSLVVLLLVATYAIGTSVVALVLPADSDLAVAVVTLAVAAAFRPLERRVRLAVDRRFNRRRFDAEQEAARFARLLRGETDLRVVEAHLGAAIAATVQPVTCSTWVRPPRTS